MKIRNKKLIALLATTAIVLPSAVIAATTTIDATANFITAITLANETAMDFADIEVAGGTTAGSTADMDDAGAITYTGNFSGAGAGTLGSVDVATGTDGLTIDIKCDATGTLGDGTETIDVVGIMVVPEDTGTAAACAGVGGAVATSMVLDITGGDDQFTFYGSIDGDTASDPTAIEGAFSTAAANGTDIGIDIFYQ